MSELSGKYFKPIESESVTPDSAAKHIRDELFHNPKCDASAAYFQLSKEVHEFSSKTSADKADVKKFVGQVEKQLPPNALNVLKKYAECSASIHHDRRETESINLLSLTIPGHAPWEKKSLTELKQEALRENRLSLAFAQAGEGADWHLRAAELKQKAHSATPTFVMWGDSITAAIKSPGTGRTFSDNFGEGAANFGIPGDTTKKLAWRIKYNGEADLKDASKLKQIVVLIGTNDLLQNEPNKEIASHVSDIGSFLAEKFPKSNVMVLGLLPRGHHTQEVKEVNHFLQGDIEAAAMKNLHFANIGPSMLEKGNMITGAFDTQDPSQLWQRGKVHPTGEGYHRLCSLIKSAIQKQS